MEPSDEELLALHLRGDRGAFAVLVTRHERRVHALCLRMLGHAEDAQDATQETFVLLLRRAGSFRGTAAFSTWLHRVALNAAVDQARRRGRASVLPLDGRPEPSVHGDPGDRVADTVTIEQALARIPEDFRAAVVLCDLCRLSYAEAAQVLEVAVGTVKSRVARGRLALARELRTLAPAGLQEAMVFSGTVDVSQPSDQMVAGLGIQPVGEGGEHD